MEEPTSGEPVLTLAPDGTVGACAPLVERLAGWSSGAATGRTLDELFAAVAAERARIEDDLRHQSLHDALTGLPNRRLLEDRLAQALAERARRGTTVALLFIDLDGFKLVNDAHGHGAGDELLIEVAHRIQGCLRAGDTVARLGGDEFVILCKDLRAADEAERVARRVTATLARPLAVGGEHVSITLSVGIAAAGPDAESAQELLAHADAAMYLAKEHGRNRTEVFGEDLRGRVERRVTLERELRRGMARDELELFYQPLVALPAGRPVGAEALLRWRHPERGVLAPADFLSVAEETGLIGPLGDWALRTACSQWRVWRDQGLIAEGFGMTVNVSPRQFADGRLAYRVADALRDTRMPAASLGIEVVESVLLGEPELQVLQEIKDLGVRLLIDDFGTGYSSLSHLRQVTVDVLKLDRSVVTGASAADHAISAAVLQMAHALGIEVLAEGVETDAHAEHVRRLGCDAAQGFHWGRPQPAAALAATLA